MGVVSISVEDLVALVESDPRRALDAAHAQLGEPALTGTIAAQLWWVVGLAQRELGDLVAARIGLERARELAVVADDRSLAARVTISLAFEVGHGGDIRSALGAGKPVGAGAHQPGPYAWLQPDRRVHIRPPALDVAELQVGASTIEAGVRRIGRRLRHLGEALARP